MIWPLKAVTIVGAAKTIFDTQSMEASPLSDFFQPNHTGLGGSSFSTYAQFSEKLAFIKKKE